MFSNYYFVNIIRFLLLVLTQVLLFNQLNFFGFINPVIYILFLYWYPIKDNRALFIFLSFLLGFIIDIFSDTLAIHAASTVTIAYLRPTIMRFVFGVNYEFQNFKINQSTRAQQITFLALLILLHHIVFFSLEIFSLMNLLLILKKTVFTFCGTLVMTLLVSALFSTKKE